MTLYLRAGLLAFVFWFLTAATSLAGTVVLANRTSQSITYSIVEPDAAATELTIPPGELVTHSISGKAKLLFQAAGKSQEVELQVDSVYSFAAGSEAIQLEPVSVPRAGSPSRKPTDAPAKPDSDSNRPQSSPSPLVISAKILVDEEEPAAQRIWEARIRNRLKAASDILERYCHATIEVVAVGTWESDNNITDFHALLRDFEQKVHAEPNCVAIGFTSQLLAASGCAELGGTRGALHSHILIREWFGRTEPERLEVLLHELGHHLGAAHSADANSVMRPKLGDGKSLSKRFRIGFDPLNTLTMAMYAEAARDRKVKSLRDLESATRVRLRDVYSEIAQAMPTDPVAAAYIARFSDPPPPPAPMVSVKTPTEPPRDTLPIKSTTIPNPSTTSTPAPNPNPTPNPTPNPIKLTPRHAAIQQVLSAIVEAGEETRQSAASEPSLSGDALAELYVRRAAARAVTLPREHAVPAFLLGIAIGLDTSDMLRSNDWTRQLWQTIEPDTQREHRLAVLGKPTIQARHDLLQHFVVSCALTVLAGPQVSEAAGILKEVNDANGGSGFSFVDLTADLAGITFATQLQAQPNRLPSLAESFKIDHHMPSISGMREGLSREQLQAAYGSPSDPRFLAERTTIVERIQSLPGLSGKSSGRN